MTKRVLLLACFLLCAPVPASAQEFVRGDVNGDAETSIVDLIMILQAGFGWAPLPGCLEAMDVDNDGALFPLLDAIFLASHMFLDQVAPPAPFPLCGMIDAADMIFLGCDEPPDVCL